jgi:hypothetical protein
MTSPRSLRWGIVFIGFGLFWLLYNNSTISGHGFWYLLTLWPLFLIAIGIEMIFKRTQLKALAYISPALLAVAFLFAGMEAHQDELHGTGRHSDRFSKKVSDGTQLLRAKVELGEYDLYVRASSNSKLRGGMTGSHSAPAIDFVESGTDATLDVKDRSSLFSWDWHSFPGVFHVGSLGSNRYPEFKLEAPTELPLSLEIEGEESHVELNLKNLSLEDVIANVNDISMSVTIGSVQPLVDISLNGIDNRLLIRLPNGAGLRIDGAGITSNLSSLGLEQENGAYHTPGFDTLSPKVNVHLTDDLERLQIKTY